MRIILPFGLYLDQAINFVIVWWNELATGKAYSDLNGNSLMKYIPNLITFGDT